MRERLLKPNSNHASICIHVSIPFTAHVIALLSMSCGVPEVTSGPLNKKDMNPSQAKHDFTARLGRGGKGVDPTTKLNKSKLSAIPPGGHLQNCLDASSIIDESSNLSSYTTDATVPDSESDEAEVTPSDSAEIEP